MLLGIYPKELKTWVHADACTLMFTAVYSQVPKLGSHHDALNCVGEWINKPGPPRQQSTIQR